jgi:4-hydroxybenzoate polyprenyltransferase
MSWQVALRLGRVSNLPTVWTNVLAGLVLAASPPDWSTFAFVAVGVSMLYTAGMFLNDAFDHRFDAVHRPDRPIPAGQVTLREAFAAGFSLLAAGLVLLAIAAPSSLAWAGALAACIVFYDWRHKQNPIAPIVMGVCRGLVYCTAAAAAGSVSTVVLAWAAAAAAYVTSLTLVAKHGGDRWGTSIAVLIAGISIVDAIAIASTGRYAIALVAAAGFPLTLLAQRWVRGT